MSVMHTYTVNVHFGDCDPAGIVFFPNFSRWMDAASLNFFIQCGFPPWREYVKATGILGTPVLEIHSKFLRPATYAETLSIDTSIIEWRDKVFIHQHIVRRDSVILCEGTETRAFVTKDPANPDRIKAVPIPLDIRKACGG
jgi:4-hydroxybenzoyl-CoA thioesterase